MTSTLNSRLITGRATFREVIINVIENTASEEVIRAMVL
jgi:hypothetical protein